MDKLIVRTCRECGADFQFSANAVARGRGQFCTRRCALTVGRRIRWELEARTIEQRFWAFVDRRGDDECWAWRGFKHKGYGRLNIGGPAVGAHRISYMVHFGEIPAGLTVLHRCDNPECTNPAHLFIGTNRDNNADRDAKGRTARGERASSAKLTDAKVRVIRAAPPSEYAALAAEYGVAKRTVVLAATGRMWGHVS